MSRDALFAVFCAIVLSFAGCDRFDDSKLIGTWRGEDEEVIEEVTLNPDHSFRSITSFKQVFATPATPILVGTWHRERNELTVDSTFTFDNTKRQFKRILSELTKDSFTMFDLGDRKTVKYERFPLPTCSEPKVSHTQPIHENDFIGSWQTHYRTHDIQFQFVTGGRYELCALINGEWDLLEIGSWSLTVGTELILKPDYRPYRINEQQTWTIMQKGIDCLGMSDKDSLGTILRRLD